MNNFEMGIYKNLHEEEFINKQFGSELLIIVEYSWYDIEVTNSEPKWGSRDLFN